jgi:hypothetical protein
MIPHLDKKLARWFSRLLYKICEACGMLPASYVVQPELTHVGEFEWSGGFADVSKGEYRGHPVAIKHLRIGTKDEFDKVFKVGDCARPGASQSLSFVSAALPGSSRLETLVAPEYLATGGSFCVKEPSVFPRHLRVDAQRKRDGIYQHQSKGQPFAPSEFRRPFPLSPHVPTTVTHSFPRSHLVLPTFTNSGLCTEISKGCATTFYTAFVSSTSFIGKCPR